MKKITMYNPKNKVIIETNENFRTHWENLGFIEMKNVVLYSRCA